MSTTMSRLSKVMRPVMTVGPVTEPITIHEVKRQLNLSASDTSHDVFLASKIASARMQYERDTDEHFIKRTMALTLPTIGELRFPHRPVSAISSITYYDIGNVSQTLSTSIYQLDAAGNQLRLAADEDWPSIYARWDAVVVTYILGSHVDSTTVPDNAKSAMLLLVCNEFEQRDMMSPDYTQRQVAYERLVAKSMRSTYP